MTFLEGVAVGVVVGLIGRLLAIRRERQEQAAREAAFMERMRQIIEAQSKYEPIKEVWISPEVEKFMKGAR